MTIQTTIRRFVLAALFVFLSLGAEARAQEEQYVPAEPSVAEGKIVQIQDIQTIEGIEGDVIEQSITVKLKKGAQVDVPFYKTTAVLGKQFNVGDNVKIEIVPGPNEVNQYFITDHIRRGPLLLLFLIFLIATVLVAKKWGLYSVIGMGYSFMILFVLVLPLILKGFNPLLASILGVLLIAPVTFTLSHGMNKKTYVSLAGTFIALTLTGLLSIFFIELAKMSGYSSEEALFLQISQDKVIDMKGLLLAGIIIGTLGILDDVTISQASIVQQLKLANKNLDLNELFKRAMHVGHDHIASAVNTLILVYTGAALPLMLLFINSSKPIAEVLNYEMIAEEIIRTLVGSIGLIAAVPITTLLAAKYLDTELSAHDVEHLHSHKH